MAGKGAQPADGKRSRAALQVQAFRSAGLFTRARMRRTPQRAPELGPVVQYCIRPFARGHRASSWHWCGSFGHKLGTKAPTHLGMPLHRCQTVGSPVAPPEALQPKTHSPLRRAPGLHSCLGCSGRIGGWPMRCGRRCARGALAGYSSGTPGGTPAESGHRRRRWCAPAIGVPIRHRGYAINVLTRMPINPLPLFCYP